MSHRLGAGRTPGFYLLLPVLAVFVQRYPGITLDLEMSIGKSNGLFHRPLPPAASRAPALSGGGCGKHGQGRIWAILLHYFLL